MTGVLNATDGGREHRARARTRFCRGARVAASVNHPNVCQVYEINEDHGELFIAMELLEGEALSERLRRARSASPTRCRLNSAFISSDQREGGSRLQIYRREGAPGNPHVHAMLAVVDTVADDTDGLDVTSRPLPGFPGGLLVMMNSAQRNFHLYWWDNVAAAISTANDTGLLPHSSARVVSPRTTVD